MFCSIRGNKIENVAMPFNSCGAEFSQRKIYVEKQKKLYDQLYGDICL